MHWACHDLKKWFRESENQSKMAKIGQNKKKIKNPSVSEHICAGLPQFEEKNQRNRKVMAQGCQNNTSVEPLRKLLTR